MQNESTSNINPLIAPEAIEFWPPQPGWYVLGLLLLIGLFIGIRALLRFNRKNKYRRLALKELQGIADIEGDLNKILKVNKILKITALNGFSRDQVANLSGDSWLQFLNTTSKKVKFNKKAEQFLAKASYQRSQEIDLSENEVQNLMETSAKWIRTHRNKHIKQMNI